MKTPILKINDKIFIDNYLSCDKFSNFKITVKENFIFKKDVVSFDSCEVVKLDFTKCQIKKLEFIDCKIIDCDFSNLEFEESIFKRCEFIGCKMLGVDFVKFTLADVLFKDCILRYSSFINSKLKDSKFDKCDCSDSSFFDIVSNKIEVNDVNFANCQFYNDDFSNIDFSNSNIDNITTDLKSIKKIIVNQDQAIALAALLDITVKI